MSMNPGALNRSLLARQMLISREKLTVLEAIEKLIGLQAQAPLAPYFALWTRLEGFRQEQLSNLLLEKQAVRMVLMRATLHLSSGRDALKLRPWLHPVMEKTLKGNHGKRLHGVNYEELSEAGRRLVEHQPLTFEELGRLLSERWTDRPAEALSAAVRNLVPLVQVPPRGIWGLKGQAVHASAEAWLGRPLTPNPDAKEFVLRYLSAYGPATVEDIQVWSGLTRLNEVVSSLRSRLVAFRDTDGRELFDLPEAPRPEADMPVPLRFLGEFDSILLSHANRSRIIDDRYRSRVFTVNGIIRPTILLDGFVAGTWSIHRSRDRSTLCVEPFLKLTGEQSDALLQEGKQLLRFAAEGQTHDIHIQT
ncbi:winged helix DNA-binding domain-containing protein [Cohnella thailandensis]|nr:winged helix DNA-binding domain-containing protein [Cohnella thailandensis]MBP1977098.1 hypothetical protein [Cohnella thailandensis]